MKQKVFFCLVMLLAMVAIPAFAEAYLFPEDPAPLVGDEITQEQALTIAQNEMMQREQISDLTTENDLFKANCVWLENGEKAWVVLLDRFLSTDAAVTVSAYGGHVMHYQSSMYDIYTDMGGYWIQHKGPKGEWSLKDQALFGWLYGSSERYLVPDESMISQQDAEEIAMAVYGKNLSALTASATFTCNTFTDGRPEQYVWMVNIREDGREVLVVHVDAQSGEVVETFDIGLG